MRAPAPNFYKLANKFHFGVKIWYEANSTFTGRFQVPLQCGLHSTGSFRAPRFVSVLQGDLAIKLGALTLQSRFNIIPISGLL